MRALPQTLLTFCNAAKDLPNTSAETARFLRSMMAWLKKTSGQQWETVVVCSWRERFGDCWALLHWSPFVRTLERETVLELRGAFGAALGGYWQQRYLPKEWSREADGLAPAQAQMSL